MLLVETTGSFQLVDSTQKNPLIRSSGYTCTEKTSFVSQRLGLSQLRFVAEVSNEARDEEWLKYVADSDGDLELAVASFESSFPTAKKEKPAAAVKKVTVTLPKA